MATAKHMAHYNEAHPVPLVVTHYINLICMCFLIFTGFMIHFPYIASIMGVCVVCISPAASSWVST